jgi:hypothetical protein
LLLEWLPSVHAELDLSLLHFEPPDRLAPLAEDDVDAVVTQRYAGVAWSAPTGVRLRSVLEDPLNVMVPQSSPTRRPEADRDRRVTE